MPKCLFTFFAACLLCSMLQAQDIHYSQFYADPIRLNTAMTGNFNGDYRVGINARSQWQSVSTPYQTLSAFADFALLKISPKDWIGLGGYALVDRAGDGVLTTVEARFSGAIHKSLTDNVYLSLGAGLTYVQKSINFQKLYFGNQWADGFFDTTINPNENFSTNSLGYLDVQSGVNITYHFLENINLHAGASVLHINQPNVSFFDDQDNRLGVRSTFTLGGAFTIERLTIEPAAYYSTQKKAREIIVGSNLAWRMGNKRRSTSRFYLGGWYRWQDAVIILTGIELSKYRILASYDINTSQLTPASNNRGGFEISLVHVGTFRDRLQKPLYCPRF